MDTPLIRSLYLLVVALKSHNNEEQLTRNRSGKQERPTCTLARSRRKARRHLTLSEPGFFGVIRLYSPGQICLDKTRKPDDLVKLN